jgi:hypothetical protein
MNLAEDCDSGCQIAIPKKEKFTVTTVQAA